MALQITDQNFKEYLDSDKPLVVDFWAEWCGPCRMIAPHIDSLSETYKESVNIGKMDVDNNNDVVGEYGIRNIPTILLFKGGEMVDKIVGATTKDAIESKIKALL
ncbi:thioredoxin [Parabacteroides sp. PF5-9]|uniref:thioredoxin n=1 Tax=Parabacteroides sp. PF5-9 TaxID=1742404 RepID=UPI0024741CE8|nr:thioredoxin [Parabacteroides sp. PF5-9]MDH6356304.1 thioredoxin 1 [Parabacteroides sp. PF5-9]